MNRTITRNLDDLHKTLGALFAIATALGMLKTALRTLNLR